MSLEDMPPPGSAQWMQWYSKQDPATQWEVQYSFGNSLPDSLGGSSTMAPELSPQGFDLSTTTSPLPEMTSKGRVLPVDVDTRNKQLTVLDKQNGMMVDNVVGMLAGSGAWDPKDFQSQQIGIGAPIQRPGHQLVEGYSEGGGYQEFIADRLLEGKTPSAAMSELMKVITGTDTGDPKLDGARDALVSSLTPRYDNNTIPGTKPAAPDLSTPSGVANTYDIKGIGDWATGMYEKILTDPQQGMLGSDNQYYGSTKEQKTSAQEYFDKYGLPYPTAQYTDPERMTSFLDAVAPVDMSRQATPEQQAAVEQDVQSKKTLNQQATTDFDALQQAWDAVQGKGQMKDLPAFDQSALNSKGTNKPASTAGVISDMRQGQKVFNNATGQWMDRPAAAPFQPPSSLPGTPQQSWTPDTKALPWIDVDADGNIRLSGKQWDTTQENYVTSHTPKLQTDQLIEDARGMLSKDPRSTRATSHRQATENDMKKVAQRKAMAYSALSDAIGTRRQMSQSPAGSGARAYQQGKMEALASTGRTPLSDALAQRVLAARAQGAYG